MSDRSVVPEADVEAVANALAGWEGNAFDDDYAALARVAIAALQERHWGPPSGAHDAEGWRTEWNVADSEAFAWRARAEAAESRLAEARATLSAIRDDIDVALAVPNTEETQST